jgi:hypothetical protein
MARGAPLLMAPGGSAPPPPPAGSAPGWAPLEDYRLSDSRAGSKSSSPRPTVDEKTWVA